VRRYHDMAHRLRITRSSLGSLDSSMSMTGKPIELTNPSLGFTDTPLGRVEAWLGVVARRSTPLAASLPLGSRNQGTAL
jgi:hypothetical protein